MSRALHAEWTKLRTAGGTGWLLLTTVVLMVGLGVLVSATVDCPSAGCAGDPTQISLTGVQVGQAVVAVLAVLAIGGEYGTGMIHVSFAAVPRRLVVLAAKALLVVGGVLLAGMVAVLGSLAAGRILLTGNGFTPAHGQAAISLGDGPTLRAAFGTVLYLVLVALLSLGVATLVRDSATAIGTVLGLLYLAPIIASVVSDPHWHKRLERAAPSTAGLAIQATRDLASLPIGPWAGLGVLALWTAAALGGGALLLQLRDA